MRQFIRAAALAAVLLLTPAAVPAGDTTTTPRAPLAQMPVPAHAALHEHVHAEAPLAYPASEADRHPHAGLAPGQSRADYDIWLAQAPRHRAEAEAFRAYLAAQRLDQIVPLWQLVRTSSAWRQCAAGPFEIAPRDKWGHIAETLRFVRDEVVPAVGPVEALSAYRNEALNACSDGAPRSAHRLFFALDLAPVRPQVTRTALIRSVCAAHARDGRAYDTGLGFYSGLRFHVDSNGFRKWGPDGRGATSPCVTGIA